MFFDFYSQDVILIKKKKKKNQYKQAHTYS